MPRQKTVATVNKIYSLKEEGLSDVAIGEILGYSTRWIEKLQQNHRKDGTPGKYVFVPDPGNSNLSAEALEYLAWDPECFIAFFNRFARPLKITPHLRSVVYALFARGTRRLLVNFPPRHGKTRLITIWFCIWLLCRNRDTTILQISETGPVAQMFLREVAAHLMENEDLIKVFNAFAPEKIRSGTLWQPNTGKLVVTGRKKELRPGELSIQALGAGQQVQGLGFDWIIADDLVGNENSDTPAQRDKMQRWFDGVLSSRLTPAGRAVVIGTRYAPDDLYGRLATKERKRGSGVKVWKHINYPAIRVEPDLPGTATLDFENGFPLWPEMWALNEKEALKLPNAGDEEFTSLEEIYASQGSDLFNQMYQQVPIPDERRLVKPEWITGEDGSPGCRDEQRAWGNIEKEPGYVRCLMLDPPQTEYGALFCADIHPDKTGEEFRAVLMELVRKKMDVPEMRQNLERMALSYKPDYLIIEINAAQRWFLQDPWATEWARKHKIRVIRHTTGQNKSDPQLGFQTLSADFEFGQISIPDATPASRQMFQILVTEATEHPFYRTADTLMALWFAKVQARNLVASTPPSEDNPYQHLGRIPTRLRNGFHWRQRKGAA